MKKLTTCFLLVSCFTFQCELLFSQQLSTVFTGGNSNEGVMFDIEVGPNDLLIESFDVNLEDQGGTYDIAIYSRVGSHAGFENSSSDWTLLETIFGLQQPNSEGVPVLLDVADFALMRDTGYAFYMTNVNLNENDIEYSNGEGTGTVVAMNEDLLIREGVGVDFGSGGFGSINANRIWNGTITYSVTSIPEPATSELFGFSLMVAVLMTRRRLVG